MKMTKLEKEIRVLSLEELEKRSRELAVAELDAKKALFERVREGIIERDISDSRTWKDLGLFAGGLFTFQLGQLFLCQPLEPKALNFVCAGLCFATSAYAVVATRLGYEKQKKFIEENTGNDACSFVFDEFETELENTFSLGSAKNLREMGKKVFSLMREADKQGYQKIYIPAISESHIGLAIMNRLKKSAGGKFIKL